MPEPAKEEVKEEPKFAPTAEPEKAPAFAKEEEQKANEPVPSFGAPPAEEPPAAPPIEEVKEEPVPPAKEEEPEDDSAFDWDPKEFDEDFDMQVKEGAKICSFKPGHAKEEERQASVPVLRACLSKEETSWMMGHNKRKLPEELAGQVGLKSEPPKMKGNPEKIQQFRDSLKNINQVAANEQSEHQKPPSLSESEKKYAV